jgi:hypothetical protein
VKRVTVALAIVGALVAVTAAAAAGPMARGSGHISFGSSREHVAFTATGQTGHAVVVDHTVVGTVVFHLDLNCVRVVGNEATLSGIVTRSSKPELVPLGYEGLFQVRDNGQGGQDPPDLMSPVLLHEVGIGPDCLIPSEFDLVPVEGGNIEIDP